VGRIGWDLFLSLCVLHPGKACKRVALEGEVDAGHGGEGKVDFSHQSPSDINDNSNSESITQNKQRHSRSLKPEGQAM